MEFPEVSRLAERRPTSCSAAGSLGIHLLVSMYCSQKWEFFDFNTQLMDR